MFLSQDNLVTKNSVSLLNQWQRRSRTLGIIMACILSVIISYDQGWLILGVPNSGQYRGWTKIRPAAKRGLDLDANSADPPLIC